MKKFFAIFFSFILPVLVLAAPIVPCNGADCGFGDLLKLANNIITFLIKIGAFVGAIVFSYAGWLYITSGGSPGNISKAKDILWMVILGFVFMLSAWLIVNLILKSLGFGVEGLDFIGNIM